MSSACDLVEFSSVDAYSNLTLKTVSILKYVLDGRERFGWKPDFLFIVDDDTWVNMDELWKRLYEEETV